MLSKLSLRNARRQARDYLVYFVTIILSAALIYAFNGLVVSPEIHNLSTMMASLPWLITLASMVVVFIIGWLVHYTTGFMLKKRSRELGTYILLGLENRQVARLFFLENLAVGGLALVLGTVLGNLLYQVLRAVTLALFKVPYAFSFSFSLKAMGLTLLYFALMYLFALLKSRKRIRRMKIYDLLYYERQNEEEVIKKGKSRRKIFVASIVLGILGTLLLLTRSLPLGLIGAAFIICFLYGFFLSFSSGVPQYFDKRPAKKYKGVNLLIFRSLSAKLGTMGMVMATIALLFTATLIAEGTGFIFNTLFQSRNVQTTSYDLFIASTSRDDSFAGYKAYIDANIPVRDEWMYAIHQADGDAIIEYLLANARYDRYFDYDPIMKQSDYAALRQMLGYPEAPPPAPGQYTLHCMEYLVPALKGYNPPVAIGGRTFTQGDIYTEHFTQHLWDGNGRGFILVVPDDIAGAQPVNHHIYAAMTDTPVTTRNGYQALSDIRDGKDKSIDGFDTIFAKGAIEEENATMYAMIVFPLFYLALVLTMVSATILTIQLLSESGRYRRQYRLLDNLGMDRKDMSKALGRQFAIFYTMPALPPIIISMPFILGLGGALDPGVLTGMGHLFAIAGITLGIFAAIYGIYILAAYTSFRRSVLPD